jgi:integrase/recombinase XerD
MSRTRPLTRAQQAILSSRSSTTASTLSSQSTSTAGTPTRTGLALGEAAERWSKSLQADNKSPRTLQAYGWALDAAKSVIDPMTPLSGIGPEHLDELLVDLRGRGWKPASVSAVERPLRAFFTWCVARGYVTRSPFIGRRPTFVPKDIPQFPEAADWARVVATTNTRSRWAFRARRDRAILLMFGSVGARLAEVAGLKVSDVDLQAPMPTMLVHGKGGKDRVLPLTPDVAEALRTYVQIERLTHFCSSSTDALWLGPKGGMTPSGIAQMVRDRAASVGVKLHPHALRHMAIHGMLASGDMLEGDVMRITGHTTRAMLDRYGAMLATERAHSAFLRMAAKRAVA